MFKFMLSLGAALVIAGPAAVVAAGPPLQEGNYMRTDGTMDCIREGAGRFCHTNYVDPPVEIRPYSDLRLINLCGGTLFFADLQGVNLEGKNFHNCHLDGGFFGVNGPSLSSSNLRDANLEGADLRSVNLGNATYLGSVTGTPFYGRGTVLTGAHSGDSSSPLFDPVAAGWRYVRGTSRDSCYDVSLKETIRVKKGCDRGKRSDNVTVCMGREYSFSESHDVWYLEAEAIGGTYSSSLRRKFTLSFDRAGLVAQLTRMLTWAGDLCEEGADGRNFWSSYEFWKARIKANKKKTGIKILLKGRATDDPASTPGRIKYKLKGK